MFKKHIFSLLFFLGLFLSYGSAVFADQSSGFSTMFNAPVNGYAIEQDYNYPRGFVRADMPYIHHIKVEFKTKKAGTYHLDYSKDNGKTWEAFYASGSANLTNKTVYTQDQDMAGDILVTLESDIYPAINVSAYPEHPIMTDSNDMSYSAFHVRVLNENSSSFNTDGAGVTYYYLSSPGSNFLDTSSVPHTYNDFTINCGDIVLVKDICGILVTLFVPNWDNIETQYNAFKSDLDNKAPFGYINILNDLDVSDIATSSALEITIPLDVPSAPMDHSIPPIHWSSDDSVPVQWLINFFRQVMGFIIFGYIVFLLIQTARRVL